METKAHFVMLGAATIIGAVLIMVFAVWLANSEFRRGFDEYDVVFDDPVRGLAEGGEVRFNGIKVGEVQSLRIDEQNTDRVIARIRVSSAIPVRTDSRAQLEPIGLTGVTLIQLSAGSPTAQLVEQSAFGAAPPKIQGSGSQIDIIVERGQEVAMRASEAMAAVRDLLTDDNIARVSRIIADLEAVTDRLAAQGSVVDRSAEAVGEMGEAASAIASLSNQMREDLAELDKAMAEIQAAGEVAANRTLPEAAMAAEDIRRASEALTRLAQQWEENPSLLTPAAPRREVELAP